MLSKEFTQHGYKLPSIPVPKPVLWVVSFWDKDAAAVLSNVGTSFEMDNCKSTNVLGVQFRDVSTTLIDMANSLIDFGFVPDLRKTQ